MAITVKHQPGRSDDTGVTVTANTAGSSTPISVLGPKQVSCPYTPGAGRYIKETTNVYRWVEHVRLAAGTTEPTTYTADNN